MLTMSQRKVIQSSFQSFLRNERRNLKQNAPILLISSHAQSEEVSTKSIDLSLRKFLLFAQQQFALPIVSSEIPSAVCTDDDMTRVESLKKRTKASIVIGLGSGAAMDLAKMSCDGVDQQLFLIPCTTAALMAAHSRSSLVLDTKEETIILKGGNLNDTTIVLSSDQEVVVHPHTIPACQALLLDAKLRGDASVDFSILDQESPLDVVRDTTKFLCSGLAHETQLPRSISLALASALIPHVFSTTHIFTFWASLVPALTEMAQQESITRSHDLPSLAALALEPQSIDSLLQRVRDNQASSSSRDVHQDVLAQVLLQSLNR